MWFLCLPCEVCDLSYLLCRLQGLLCLAILLFVLVGLGLHCAHNMFSKNKRCGRFIAMSKHVLAMRCSLVFATNRCGKELLFGLGQRLGDFACLLFGLRSHSYGLQVFVRRQGIVKLMEQFCDKNRKQSQNATQA